MAPAPTGVRLRREPLSASRSMSPRKATVAMAGSRWTSASKRLVCIVGSSQVHRQGHGLRGARRWRSPSRRPCARSGTGPSHAASARPPAWRRGRAAQLIGDRAAAGRDRRCGPTRSSAVVQTTISTGTSGSFWLPYSMAFMVASLTAVLSRSRRAGSKPDRGRPRRRRASMAIRSLPGSPGTVKVSRTCRSASSSAIASGRRLGRRAEERVLATAGALQGDERDVVLLLPAAADERSQLLEQLVDQLATGPLARHRDPAVAGSRTSRRPGRGPRSGRRCRAGRSAAGR